MKQTSIITILNLNSVISHHEDLIWRSETGPYIYECGVVPNLEGLDSDNYDVVYSRKPNWLTAIVKPRECQDEYGEDRAISTWYNPHKYKCGIKYINSNNFFRPCLVQSGKYHCNRSTGQWTVSTPVKQKCYKKSYNTCQDQPSKSLIPDKQTHTFYKENFCGSNNLWPKVDGTCFNILEVSDFSATELKYCTEDSCNIFDEAISAIPCGFKFSDIFDYENQEHISFEISGGRDLNFENDLFSNLKISSLSLKENGMRSFNKNLLKNANYNFIKENLYNLDLSNNRLTENTLADDIFTDLQALNEHKLHRNKITFIKSKWFENIYDYSDIVDLSYNLIETISDTDFNSNTKPIYKLDLSYNKISYISPNAFIHLSNTEVINLSYNRLINFESQNLQNIASLDFINLQGNRLEYVTEGSFGAQTTVDLDENRCTPRDCNYGDVNQGYHCWCE